MKKFALIFCSVVALLAFNAHGVAARPWNTFEEGRTYLLTQRLRLGNSGPDFAVGFPLRFLSEDSLQIPGAAVTLLTFVQESCDKPELSSEMEIILTYGNDENTSVGVQIAPGCRWEIFVEQKDLSTPSFLGPQID